MSAVGSKWVSGAAQLPLHLLLCVLALLYLWQQGVRASVPPAASAHAIHLEAVLETDLLTQPLQGEAFRAQLDRALREHAARSSTPPPVIASVAKQESAVPLSHASEEPAVSEPSREVMQQPLRHAVAPRAPAATSVPTDAATPVRMAKRERLAPAVPSVAAGVAPHVSKSGSRRSDSEH